MAADLGAVAVHMRLGDCPEFRVGSVTLPVAGDEQGQLTVNVAEPLAELLREMAAELERQHAGGEP